MKIEEKQLINILENFMQNSPTFRTTTKIGNRMDPTAVTYNSCIVYLPDLDFKPDMTLDRIPTEQDFPEILEYEIKMINCWGNDIIITQINNNKVFEAYFDEEWCPSEDRIDNMNEIILKILEYGKYNEERNEDYD